MDFKFQGIIIGKRDVGETDRIYTIYTKEIGKTKAIAKGVRKSAAKLSGHLETISLAEVFVSKNKGIGSITGSIVTNNFPNIKSHLETLEQVFFVFKKIDQLIPEQEKDETIFDLLKNYLETLENIAESSEEKRNIIFLGFLFQLLSVMGYKLEMARCLICGKVIRKGLNYVDISKGGTICSDCGKDISNKIKISEHAIKLIRIFLSNKLENLIKIKAGKAETDELRDIFEKFLAWIRT